MTEDASQAAIDREYRAPGVPRVPLATAAVAIAGIARRQRLPWNKTRSRQLCALSATVDHARRHVPFYRALYGDDHPIVDTPDDVARLPLLAKADVRDVPVAERRAGPPPPRTRLITTSGSTGEPLAVEYGPRAAWWQGVWSVWTGLAQGSGPWKRHASLVANGDPRPRSGTLRLAERRKLTLNLRTGSDEQVEALIRFRPQRLAGLPHLLADVADRVAGRISPEIVATYGQSTPPEIRRHLVSVFGVEPLDLFGTAEHGMIAWKCRKGDLYHLNHECVLVELVDERGNAVEPGEVGELVVSTLWNPLMPFVRYRTGDRAVWATRPCGCGHAWPAIERFEGRVFDWFVDSNGRAVAPERLWLIAHADHSVSDHVLRYRLVQRSDRVVQMEMVVSEAFPPESTAAIARSYARLLGAEPMIEIVDRLDLAPSGKFTQFRSHATNPDTG